MNTIEIIGLLIGLILILLGVIAIYDARKLSQKLFNFYDKNSGTKWLKVAGFIASFMGALIIFFIIPKA